MTLRTSLPALAILLVLFSVLACATSSDDDAAQDRDELAVAEAEDIDKFEEKRQAAEAAFAGRIERDQAQEAIDAWKSALETEQADEKEDAQIAEVYESLARAHYFMARYHDAQRLEPGQEVMDSARSGLQAAQKALELRDPDFYRALRQGAPFEADFPEMKEEALDALLWYAKNTALATRADGSASAAVQTTPVLDAIMETVLEQRPDAYFGAAHRYFGVRWVVRPLHKSPDKSRTSFEKSVEIAPDFLMNRLLWVHHLAITQGDRETFETQLQAIIDHSDDEDFEAGPENEMARQWAKDLLQHGDRLFE